MLGGHRKETVDGRQLPVNAPLLDTIWPAKRTGRTLRETHDPTPVGMRPAHAARCACPRLTAQRRLQHAHRAAWEWQQSQRIHLGRAPMAVTSKRERALQVVLVVLGLLTASANIYPLVTSFVAGLRPTGGTTAPMSIPFWRRSAFSWCSRHATPPRIAA